MINAGRAALVLLMLFCSGVGFAVARRAVHSQRKVARAQSFSMMALSAAVWMLLVGVNLLIANPALKEIVWWLIPFAILNTLMGLFFFSMEFSFRLKRVPRGILFSTIVITLVITLLAATNSLHHQFWTVVFIDGEYVQKMGPFFAYQLIYTYLLTLGSLVMLVRAFWLSSGVVRRQTLLLLVGILIPVLTSVAVDAFGWNPVPVLDLPALSIVVPVVLFSRATLQFNTFYLLPVASDLIIKNMLDGVLATDVDGYIIFSNPAVQAILGKTEAQLSGCTLDSVLEDWQPEALHAWKAGKESTQLTVGEEDPLFYHLSISKIAVDSSEPVGFLLKLNNNTEQKTYEKRLNDLAICDPLTGSYNRRYFYEMAHTYFNQMERSGRPLSLLMLDLDHFKNINDSYGHLKGDLVLQKVAALCRVMVRTQDIFSRYGGEEFILAMPETSLQNALAVAERLRRGIELLRYELDGITVTASIGVVETTGEADLTLDMLLSRVDEAMYASKHAGRNRVSTWKE